MKSLRPAVLISSILLILLTIVGVALVGAVWAAERWVAGGGSDVNPGTKARPWLTLQHAVDSVAPGDVIKVKAGTYAGCRVEKSGKAGSPKKLMAAPGAVVLLNRPGAKNRHQSIVEFETWEGDGTVSYWVLEGFSISGAQVYGVDVRGSENAHSHHISIVRNKVSGSGKTGIFTAFADDILVADNISQNNGEHGVYISNSGKRPRITDNTLFENYGCGLHMNGDREMGGYGMIVSPLVQRNTIYGNGVGGGAGINLDGVEQGLFSYNFLYGNRAGGVAVFRENGARGSRNNKIINNYIYMPENSRWAVNIAQSDCINNRLEGNTIYTESWRGSISIPTPKLQGFISRNNLVIGRFSVDGGDTIIGFSQWRALGYGQGTRLISGSLRAYTVSGRVTKGGKPVRNLAISFGARAGRVYTDSNGRYDKVLPRGWTGVFYPQGGCLVFTPVRKNLKNLRADQRVDFKAYPGSSLSGRVLHKGKGLRAVSLVFTSKGGRARTNTAGYFSRRLPCAWSGVVRPARKGYRFSPSRFTVKNLRGARQGLVFKAYRLP